jgi:hypothetical protein
MHDFEDLLTLSQAAKVAPGRPSSNCVWRWCRRGLSSRAGERVYLQHVRVGGKIYTRTQWLDQFWRTLADADVQHFRLKEEALPVPAPTSLRKVRRERFDQHRRESIATADRELEDAGL